MTTATAIRERPILFSGPMVRAILDGRKTQTRRIIKPQPVDLGNDDWQFRDRVCISSEDLKEYLFHDIYGGNDSAFPYGGVYEGYGDRLWVRESFDIIDDPAAHDPNDGPKPKPPKGYEYDCPPCVKRGPNGERWVVDYAANENTRVIDKAGARRWRPSIHMPRWASRITLELTDVRVERLQDISESDAVAEGIERSARTGKYIPGACDYAAWAYRELWDQINGAGAWETNPWVWVLCFRRLEAE